MTHYLIEIRFFGKAKWEIKKLISQINNKFHIRTKHRAIPHITLAGPFYTRNERKLIYDFKKLCGKQPTMSFNVRGYDTFENTNVVFIKIDPEDNLTKFRRELSKTIKPYCNLSPFDLLKDFKFHATLAMKLNECKFRNIKKYIKKIPRPNFKYSLMRVAIIKNKKILCEYDFMLNKLLNRYEAKNKGLLGKSFAKLGKSFAKNSPKKNKEKISPTDYFKPIERDLYGVKEIKVEEIKSNFLRNLINKFRAPKIFFIGDTHFDHKNIIRYCKRPFKTEEEMNDVLKNNWNNLIKSNDIVFFLGDMSYGRGSMGADYWLKKLNGNIFFIRGNHERLKKKSQVYDELIINYENEKFFLTHDAKNIPKNWSGWSICGHHHNNKPVEHPLINKKTKQFNVSVELINYKPIEFNELLKVR